MKCRKKNEMAQKATNSSENRYKAVLYASKTGKVMKFNRESNRAVLLHFLNILNLLFQFFSILF